MFSEQHMGGPENIRKRVCKACDRCRLKKSKCDGASPCSRCKADNAICVFGERKKSQDKVYPKGYVEMLEQQQSQLVAGLRDLYHRLQPGGEGWPGRPLHTQPGGHPLTHDILERLDLLHTGGDGDLVDNTFEEDTNRMQQKLIESGAHYTHRRGSVSSNEELIHTTSSSPLTNDTTPTPSSSFGTGAEFFAPNYTMSTTPPSTIPSNSPFPRHSQIVQPKTQPPNGRSGMPSMSFPPAMQPMSNTWLPKEHFNMDMSFPALPGSNMCEPMYDTSPLYNNYPGDIMVDTMFGENNGTYMAPVPFEEYVNPLTLTT